MDIYEEEYKCIDKTIKIGNISILSLKSNKEESNNEPIKRIKDNEIKNNLNLSKENNNSELKDDQNLINNKFLFDFTDKIYNKDEHLNEILIKKKNSTQSNLLHLNYIPSFNSYQNYDKKTSVSKMDKTRKMNRKSLFHDVKMKNPFEEEKVIDQKTKGSLISKVSKGGSKKNNNFEAFFKLKPKVKKPPKILYMDTAIKNLNNSKINCSFNNRIENKQNTIKIINTIKTFNKEIIFNPKNFEDEIIKKEDKEEKNIIIKSKINNDVEEIKNDNKIKIKQLSKTEKKAKSTIKKLKLKCIPFHYLFCLKCNID